MIALIALLAAVPAEEEQMNIHRDMSAAKDSERPTAERIEAIRRLTRSRSGAVIVSLSLEVSREIDEAVKAEIRRALREMQATAFFAENLRSPDDRVRRQAAELIRLVPSPEGVAPLIAALSDPLSDVRKLAVVALARFRDPAAVAPLAKVLASDPEAGVRAAAARALGILGGTRAIAALEQARESDASALVRDVAEQWLR